MPLHRPYIRNDVRAEVEKRAPKNENGQFLDANTGKPIEGSYDLGHKPGHEHWREVDKAEKEGLTQEQFNNRMNNPDYYQIEDPHENRSHVHEQRRESSSSKFGSKPSECDNDFLNNNPTIRGEKTIEAAQPTENVDTEQGGQGNLSNSDDGELKKAVTSSSDNSGAKASVSTNSAKAAEEASKAASDQAVKNDVANANGMGM